MEPPLVIPKMDDRESTGKGTPDFTSIPVDAVTPEGPKKKSPVPIIQQTDLLGFAPMI